MMYARNKLHLRTRIPFDLQKVLDDFLKNCLVFDSV